MDKGLFDNVESKKVGGTGPSQSHGTCMGSDFIQTSSQCHFQFRNLDIDIDLVLILPSPSS